MTALEQKRQQYVNQLQQLKTSKQNEINQKVEAYRKQITQQIMNSVNADEAKIQAVITALDKVIEFEKTAH